MPIRLVSLIVLSVCLSALAQICFKSGMSSTTVHAALAKGVFAESILAVGFNAHVLVGFGLYAFSAILWLWVLARTQLSLAYPFVSLGFVLTMLAGAWLFGESLTVAKIAGTALVCCGVALLAFGE
jgi:multidrug transporter EmrE-like cation transporter